MLLKMEDVSFSNQQKVILSAITLQIEQGQHWAIIGPNGAGKSTLLQIMAGLLPHHSGHIYLNDRPLSQFSRQQKAQLIAFVHQQDRSDVPLKVGDYIALGRIPRCGSRDKYSIDQLLDSLQLSAFKQRYFYQLSGGEQQKIRIARALYQQPMMLFLDEPTNHLDPLARHQLLGWLRQLDITIVMVMHDLALAKYFSSHALIMAQGQLVAAGENDQVLKPDSLSDTFQLPILALPHPDERVTRPFLVYDARSYIN